jgi:hypothetical protein
MKPVLSILCVFRLQFSGVCEEQPLIQLSLPDCGVGDIVDCGVEDVVG